MTRISDTFASLRGRGEAALIPDHYERFGDRLPPQLWDEHRALVERLDSN